MTASVEELEIWNEAVKMYDDGQFEESAGKFSSLSQNSKMMFNIGCCYLRLNDVTKASEVCLFHYSPPVKIRQGPQWPYWSK